MIRPGGVASASRSDGDADAFAHALLFTCEHAGRDIPESWRHRFEGADAVLSSHRGLDIGAAGVALRLASALHAPLMATTVTRLLVDANRSEDGPDAFSEFTRDLSDAEREHILRRWHRPHRAAVADAVRRLAADGRIVVHIGVHSFTDVLDGDERAIDVALLYDPSRPAETAFCRDWSDAIAAARPEWRLRFNEPYRGWDDGLTTTLRGTFPESTYLGIEIEVRQGMLTADEDQVAITDAITPCLAAAMARVGNKTGDD